MGDERFRGIFCEDLMFGSYLKNDQQAAIAETSIKQ